MLPKHQINIMTIKEQRCLVPCVWQKRLIHVMRLEQVDCYSTYATLSALRTDAWSLPATWMDVGEMSDAR